MMVLIRAEDAGYAALHANKHGIAINDASKHTTNYGTHALWIEWNHDDDNIHHRWFKEVMNELDINFPEVIPLFKVVE